MTSPATPSDRQALNQKLVQELIDMRDALVTLSLSLKDWKFELDQPGRQAAQAQIDALLTPMRLTPMPGGGVSRLKKGEDCLPE